MRRRSGVAPRRVIFVGVEGKSDRAVAQQCNAALPARRVDRQQVHRVGRSGLGPLAAPGTATLRDARGASLQQIHGLLNRYVFRGRVPRQ